MEKRGANKILPRITAFTADWSTRWLPRRATQTTRTAGLEDPYYSDIANRRSSADTFFRHLADALRKKVVRAARKVVRAHLSTNLTSIPSARLSVSIRGLVLPTILGGYAALPDAALLVVGAGKFLSLPLPSFVA